MNRTRWMIIGAAIVVGVVAVGWHVLDGAIDEARAERDAARADLQVAREETAVARRQMLVVRDSLQAAEQRIDVVIDSLTAERDTAVAEGREQYRRLRAQLTASQRRLLDSLSRSYERALRLAETRYEQARRQTRLVRAELREADRFIARQDSLIGVYERTVAAERRVAGLLEAKLRPSLAREALLALPAAGACVLASTLPAAPADKAAVGLACAGGYVGSRYLARN